MILQHYKKVQQQISLSHPKNDIAGCNHLLLFCAFVFFMHHHLSYQIETQILKIKIYLLFNEL